MLFKRVPKDPGETLDYRFDWGTPGAVAPYLEPGETIAAFSIAVPAGLTKESDDIVDAGRAVLVWLSGGTAGKDYDVTCTITTNTSRTAVRTMTIACEKR